MTVSLNYSYSELKAELSIRLGRDIPASTLSRWMGELGYKQSNPFGQPVRRPKRCWDEHDLNGLADYGYYLSLGYSSKQAQKYAQKNRSDNHGVA